MVEEEASDGGYMAGSMGGWGVVVDGTRVHVATEIAPSQAEALVATRSANCDMVDSAEDQEQPRRAVPIAPLGLPPNAVARAVTLPGEFPKGKRRGLAGTPNGEGDAALTPEERMKQKRMLRNRESAARSRDKRRNRNVAMQQDIEARRARILAIDALYAELEALVEAARDTLRTAPAPAQ